MSDSKQYNNENDIDSTEIPSLSVQAQYVKDFSFENLAPPGSLNITSTPSIDLKLDIHVTKLPEDDHFEVALSINARALHDEDTLFIVELEFAGIFYLANIPEEQHQIVLGINCPALIFPYARKIVADITQEGGFQPLMMEPIDFARLYQRRLQEEEKER